MISVQYDKDWATEIAAYDYGETPEKDAYIAMARALQGADWENEIKRSRWELCSADPDHTYHITFPCHDHVVAAFESAAQRYRHDPEVLVRLKEIGSQIRQKNIPNFSEDCFYGASPYQDAYLAIWNALSELNIVKELTESSQWNLFAPEHREAVYKAFDAWVTNTDLYDQETQRQLHYMRLEVEARFEPGPPASDASLETARRERKR